MSAPTSPSAARRVTSPSPATSPTTATAPARAASVKPATPEKPKSVTPAPVSPPKPSGAAPAPVSPPKPSPKKSEDDKDKAKDKHPAAASNESIPDAVETLDIDETVFSQITEMDEEDDCDFSSEIVQDYFKQATTTLGELNDALANKDFKTLSSKGHFLKGSSAALGVKKVQESCEHIQHYGNKRDEVKGVDLTEAQALRRIELIMLRLARDYASAKVWLKNYYRERGVELEDA
ncbi:hypothetical protein OPQ81_011585 [Rhizoctonia solani]|nr:hypothetical protein OPQ81_011585 [Rhizoctonia solani]